MTRQGRREYIFLLAICVSICFAGRNRRRGKAKQLKIRFQKAEYKSFRWRGIQHAKVLQQFKSFVNLFLRLTSYLPKISQRSSANFPSICSSLRHLIKYFLSIFPSFFFSSFNILATQTRCIKNMLLFNPFFFFFFFPSHLSFSFSIDFENQKINTPSSFDL